MTNELRAAIDALVLAILAAVSTPTTTPPPVVSAPVALIQQSDLVYQGAFRLPKIPALQYPDGSAAFHDGLLLVKGRDDTNTAFDFTIPVLGTGAVNTLPVATVTQSYLNGLDGGLRYANNPRDTMVRGFLFVGPKLVLSIASYYDAANAQRTSHLQRDWPSGPVTAYALTPIGHTAGYMTLSTGELAPALTGNFGLPIVTRESWGPAAFIFDPVDLSKPATPVLDYPDDARSLGPWNGQSEVWNSRSTLGGMHQIGNSLLFVGVHGTGPFCYGDGFTCNDPEGGGQGTHSYPYVARIWAYDTADLIKVKHGQLKPWEPKPYGLWNLTLPYPSTLTRIGSAYDPATKRLFIVQGFGDQDVAQGFPIVHVYQVMR